MPSVQPTTRYVTVDGSRIAYQDFGSGPVTIVASAGSFSHTDVVWEDPAAALFYSRLGAFARIVRYDRLGTSNSDPLPPEWEPTLDSFTLELDAVLQAIGVDEIVLLAMLDAGPHAVEFAVAHPERVHALILYNTTARLAADDGYDVGFAPEEIDALFDQLEALWGTESLVAFTAARRVCGARLAAWFGKFVRSIGPPRAIAQLLRLHVGLDARAARPQVSVPALVMHRAGYAVVPASHGRYLADHIPGSTFVEIPGTDGAMFWAEP